MTDKLPREIERKDLRVGDVFRYDGLCHSVFRITDGRLSTKVGSSDIWQFIADATPVTLVSRAEPEPRFVVGQKYHPSTLPVGSLWWSRDMRGTWRVDGAHATNLDTGSTIDMSRVDGPRTLVSLPDPYVPPDVDEKPMLNLEQAILEAKRTDDESNYPKPKNKFTVKGRVKSVTDCTGRTKTTPRQCRCPFEARSRLRRLSTCDVCDGVLPDPGVLESEVKIRRVGCTWSDALPTGESGWQCLYTDGDCDVIAVAPTREAALCALEKALGRRIVRSSDG